MNLTNNICQFSIAQANDALSLGQVEGYAALYYDPTNSGSTYHVSDTVQVRLARTAFQNLNHQKNDVTVFFGHQMDSVPLARTSSQSAKVWLDNIGMRFSFSLPKTKLGEEIYVALQRGDLSQMSFSGEIEKATWGREGNVSVKTIHSFSRILEVSIVSNPAFLGTSARLVAGLVEEEIGRAHV